MSEGGNLGWDYWEENRGWENDESFFKSLGGSKGLYLAVAGGVAIGATALFLTRSSWMTRPDDLSKIKRDALYNSLGHEASISTTKKAEHRGYRESDIAPVLQAATREGIFGIESQPVAIFYDLDAQKETLLALIEAFPPHFFHTFAVKANPLPFVIRTAVELGMGCEAASYGEMMHAIKQGCPADKIVFDSPAKTVKEIEEAISLGVRLNADNLVEVDRIAQALSRQGRGRSGSLHIGIRLNPLVGLGSIAALSVSDERSKFGVELSDATREAIIETFLRYDFLDGLHVHVGSQGCSLQQLAEGARRVADLADEIDRRQGRSRIRYLDIGGGLPVNFKSAAVSPSFGDYASELRRHAPSLWSNPHRAVITEYGRTVCAKAGWAASAVEYVKPLAAAGDRVAIVQAGADLFVRSCYAQASFPLRLTAHHRTTGEPLPPAAGGAAAPRYDVAGPLCFGGDKLAVRAELPPLEEGDVIVVHDSGANTLALWSHHCSRLAPPVYGYTRAGADGGPAGLEIRLLKPAQRLEDVINFWDPAPPAPPLVRVMAGLRRAAARWLHGLAGPVARA